MFREGKWARAIIEKQNPDGSWGWFHTLSKSTGDTITTEQALRRLEILGYTINDEPISKAVSYMQDCLVGRNSIPDRREKLHNWDIFTSLMLSTWIRRFTKDSPDANETARHWAYIISRAFSGGAYDPAAYAKAYSETFREKPRGGRLTDFVSFYQASLLSDMLDDRTQLALLDYILDRADGVYYIYNSRLRALPPDFKSREASYYLSAVELLARYPKSPEKLAFVSEWLMENRTESGWDMGQSAKDGIYFPLSDSWRRKEDRIADCTYRIENLLKKLK